ncbi:type II toxin-antitoxin system Phd/YefM family antitoxin [Candidatus Entotheonella palauensis]|uniref:Antitoxin n=1 Tax=Candidatus Entotheonella gemina TaxID=1429439 RepID=W4M8J6_9BACT|nr:type II toxin-antitoxin system Phd/YefM family antitoxin [Candidatus Entotheonella palauensis]ETX05952.1 MAG: prevent-host-death protein [Candidatus Entotheonella gemina]
MTVYTFSEARQNLASVLEQAKREGAVQIKRRDGSLFTIMPVPSQGSPLNVGYVDIDLTQDEIVSAVRAGRERPYTSPVEGEL